MGRLDAEVAVGGPMVAAGAPIPLPLSTVGASYGIASRADVHAHLHPTPLIAFGTAGIDAGASVLLLEQLAARPAVTATARGYVFTDFATAVWPYAEISITGSWRAGQRATPFVTLTTQYAFVDRAFSWSPGAGVELTFGRFAAGVELRWYDPTYGRSRTVVPWVSPGDAGALGLVLGARYRFDLMARAEP